jgi:hypothetical protein
MVSAASLIGFHAHLPSGLDERQTDAVIAAAESLAQLVWNEASRAEAARAGIRNDFRHEERTRAEKTALAEAFDRGWEAHRLEVLAQEKDPTHAIRRVNPWRSEEGQ